MASLALALSVGLLAFAPLGAAYVRFGVIAGFASAIYGQLVAGLLGGSTHPGSGPRASTSLVLAGVVATLVADPALAPVTTSDVERIVALAGATVVLAGVLQIVFGALGAGVFARYVPYPFIAGFMCGAAALILISQIPPVTGVAHTELAHHPMALWTSLHPATLFIAAVTAAVMWHTTRRSTPWPGSLLGLVAGTVCFHVLQLLTPHASVGPVLGSLGASFPLPTALGPLFDTSPEVVRRHLFTIASGAAVIAIIGSLDTLFGAVAIDHATDGRHDARRELLAHGVANVASGLCGGVPVVLSPARALASWRAGSRDRTSVVVAAVVLAIVLAGFGGVLARIPLAVLGGVMVMLGIGLIDNWTQGLARRLRAAGMRPDPTLFWSAVTVASVAVTAVFAGFIAAIAVGFLFSGLLFFIGMNRALVRCVVDATVRPSRRVWGGENAARVQEARKRIQLVELQGALFFGSAERLAERVEPLAGVADVVVLDFRRVTTVDATGALLVERLARRLARRDTHLVLAGVTAGGRHGSTFVAHGAFRDPATRLWFQDADQAVEWAEDRALQRLGRGTEGEVPLDGFGLLHGMDSADVAFVQQRLTCREYVAGEVLFREGDPGDRLCLIAKGAVAITIAAGIHRVRIVTMAAGAFFGEAALLDGRPRSATAEAVERTAVWELTRDALKTIGDERPVLAMRIMTNLARQLSLRMRETNEILRRLEETPG